jgi:hypothetical protein
MSVGTWQPQPPPIDITPALLDRLIAAGSQLPDDGSATPDALGFSGDDASRHAALMRQPAEVWQRAVAGRADDELIALVRFFTVAEQLPGWQAGAASPVIPIAGELRARGSYPPALTRWIRAVSDNRFLPYGSVLDRL